MKGHKRSILGFFICISLIYVASALCFVGESKNTPVLVLTLVPFVFLCFFVGHYWFADAEKRKTDPENTYDHTFDRLIIVSIGLAVMSYSVSPLLFMIADKVGVWFGFALLNLFLGVLCVIPTLTVAYALVRYRASDESSRFYHLAIQAVRSKFSILAMYGSLFISLILLFAVSLFFYDKSFGDNGEYGLYMSNYAYEKEDEEQSDGGEEADFDSNKVFSYYFEESKFQMDEVVSLNLTDGTKATLKNDIEEVAKLIKEMSKGFKRIVIVLTGGTNSVPIMNGDGDFTTNRDLAHARVETVKHVILGELYLGENDQPANWINIEWVYKLKPSKEEKDCPNNFDTLHKLNIVDKNDNKIPNGKFLSCKFVNVSMKALNKHIAETATEYIESAQSRKVPRKEELDYLDYIYFTTYTISTTGYGDIIPVTPFTKFVTILANLIEVLFLAVMLSLLISHNHSEKESDDKAPVDDLNNKDLFKKIDDSIEPKLSSISAELSSISKILSSKPTVTIKSDSESES
ncbi:MAG: hypothetical protein ACI8WB_005238 [Phenylobacterium sp.]|jgi:hypothetical protein